MDLTPTRPLTPHPLRSPPQGRLLLGPLTSLTRPKALVLGTQETVWPVTAQGAPLGGPRELIPDYSG